MKNKLYSLLAFLLVTTIASSQTIPTNDAEHRIMMNTFATNVENVLLANPTAQSVGLDNFKIGILFNTTPLSGSEINSINNYAAPLLAYANQFKSSRGLTDITSNAELLFLSSFAPSTVIQNGKLVENTTTSGLTAAAMWDCALSRFQIGECSVMNGLTNDKSDVRLLSKAATTYLTQYAGDIGVLVMIGGFSDCQFLASAYTMVSSSPSISIRGINLYNSEPNVLERRIDFINSDTKGVYETFKVTAACDDTSRNAESEIRAKTFTGSFIIENSTGFIMKVPIINGVSSPPTWGIPRSDCSFTQVHDCVSFKITNMSWIEYGACLIEAPNCYLLQWDTCLWEVCFQHKRYINPYN